ncbi:MAG: HEAT repeat domain-containing protein [Candidatus Gastranaerophilales bacterium]|nr:HEAT repeat domain-containing protein [Candidatus Gastranaerophilales bacterium]
MFKKEREEIAKLEHIIEALGAHKDPKAIDVLERLGTNSPDDEIRELTAKALIGKNDHDSLVVLIVNKGKGINDLSPKVAMHSVNEILSLNDKTEVVKILEDTMSLHSDEEVRETARSVKALIELS